MIDLIRIAGRRVAYVAPAGYPIAPAYPFKHVNLKGLTPSMASAARRVVAYVSSDLSRYATLSAAVSPVSAALVDMRIALGLTTTQVAALTGERPEYILLRFLRAMNDCAVWFKANDLTEQDR